MMIDKTCILITGVSYSGKSIPAGVLHHLGIHMGDFRLTPDPIYNRHDYYENIGIVDRHGDMTKTRNLPGNIQTIYDVCERNFRYSYNDIGKKTMRFIIETIASRYRHWGLKDPRLCIPNLFSDFADIAQEYSIVKLIICERDFDEILQCNIDEMDGHKMPDKYTCSYLSEYVKYFKYLADQVWENFDGEKIKVEFNESIDSPDKFLQKICNFANVEETYNAKLFLEKRLEHRSVL